MRRPERCDAPGARVSASAPKTTPGFPAYERRNTLTHYLRLFLTANPSASIAVIGRVFDLDAKRAHQAVRYARHTLAIETRKYRRRELPAAPSTFLVPGVGDRRDDCERYAECIEGASRAMTGPARCPKTCRHYAPANRTLEFLHLAASRPGAEHAS